MNKDQVAQLVDHTLLKADANEEQLKVLCEEAMKYSFKTVCINPTNISYCAKILEGSNVGVCTVIGFPLGASTSSTKAFETKNAIEMGATEVDMVINVGAVKSENWQLVKSDIKTVIDAAKATPLKVIIETALLTNDEKVRVCQICKEVGTAFVKTSTGFSTGGATPEDIALMRETVGPDMGVKASGGVRSLETAEIMVKNGATRLGTSSGIAIMEGLEATDSY